MARSMDSILSDQPTVNDLPESSESVPEKVETEKVETKTEKEPIKPEAPKAEDHDEDEHVPDDLHGLKRALAAARGDKRKARKQWQETEKAMAELRGRMSATEKQNQPERQEPKPVDLTDEEFFGKGPEAVKAYVNHMLSTVRDEQRQQRLNYSEAAARERHEDFQEVFDDFKRFAANQPHLWQQMDASHDPGEFVYRTGKTYRELQGVNNIDDLRKKIESEVRAKIESERADNKNSFTPPPKSIAGSRGTGSAAQTWTGPRPMDEILGRS